MADTTTYHLSANAHEVARELLKIGCVKFSVDDPFTWVSGIKSPIYCDNRKINSHIESRNVVLNAFVNLIRDKFPGCDSVTGVATGGIPMGILAADRLEKPFTYVRQEPKKYGLKKQIEGDYNEGDKVVLIEDLVSTGGSSLKAINGIKDANLEVMAIISIVTYGFPVSVERFQQNDVVHYSLCDLNTLLEAATEMNYLDPTQKESVLRFKEDPNGWG